VDAEAGFFHRPEVETVQLHQVTGLFGFQAAHPGLGTSGGGSDEISLGQAAGGGDEPVTVAAGVEIMSPQDPPHL